MRKHVMMRNDKITPGEVGTNERSVLEMVKVWFHYLNNILKRHCQQPNASLLAGYQQLLLLLMLLSRMSLNMSIDCHYFQSLFSHFLSISDILSCTSSALHLFCTLLIDSFQYILIIIDKVLDKLLILLKFT